MCGQLNWRLWLRAVKSSNLALTMDGMCFLFPSLREREREGTFGMHHVWEALHYISHKIGSGGWDGWKQWTHTYINVDCLGFSTNHLLASYRSTKFGAFLIFTILLTLTDFSVLTKSPEFYVFIFPHTYALFWVMVSENLSTHFSLIYLDS